MDSPERDIARVLVTGAGASCEFGIGGARLPLMTDWAESLVKKLVESSSGYLGVTGLSGGLSAQEFEERLGKFLRDVLAFAQVRDVVVMSKNFAPLQPNQSALATEGVLEAWYQSTRQHLDQVVGLIHESLFEQFAEPALDVARANDAYGRLFAAFGVGPQTPWVYATTNYDRMADQVIPLQGMLADWGEPPQPAGSADRVVKVDTLLDGLPRYVPILHLHGRVGWYRQAGSDGRARIYSTPVTRHQAGFGVPIVMLPDPDKAYAEDPIINSIWTQFTQALGRAQRVLVLGHSLNDEGVMQALRQNVQPLQRLGVTVLASEADPQQPDRSTNGIQKKVETELPGAAVIPLRFGAENANYEGVRDWLQRTASID